MATRPTHIYASSLNRRDKRWRARHRRTFAVGPLSVTRRSAAVAGLVFALVAERLVA